MVSGTIRQQIITLLTEEELSARDISQLVSIREKEVCLHLDHINRSVSSQGKVLVVTPCQCLSCGFIFKDRQRLSSPGRCPQCKGSHISMARYRIVRK
jgi:predicted Zn-ribbon and HTH transcriptional regulator